MYSLLIKNGFVVDGIGAEPVKADIAIDGGEIVNIAPKITVAAKSIIEASGLVVAPGFIDAQNHSDSHWQLLENPELGSLIAQGFTTIAVGHCGGSLAPVINDKSLLPIRKWHDLGGANVNWKTFTEFRNSINARGLGTNMVSFVGYETLRRSLTGDEIRSLTGSEREILRKLIAQNFAEGAAGVSLGLTYSHEWNAPERDLEDVFSLAAAAHKPVSVHLRNEGSHIFDALAEIIHLAKQSGATVKVSHLKIRDRRNWGELGHLKNILENAARDGINIWFDVYPYDTTWQVLYRYLPHWATGGGRDAMLKALIDPVKRRKIKDHLSEYSFALSSLVLASTTNHINAIGKAVSEIARSLELSMEETVLHILQNGGSEIMVFDKNLGAETVEALTLHEQSIIATDGGGFPLPTQAGFSNVQNKLIHPRCYGTTARFLANMIKTKQLSLEKAIQKLTSTPASMLGLKKRGALAIGNMADIVIFDPESLEDLTTLQNPYQQPKGFEHVLVSGSAVVSHGRLTGQRPGRFLSI